MRFFLGTHKARWLWHPGAGFASWFVSAHALTEAANPRPARWPWALDSGAFTEMAAGGWRATARQYAAQVAQWQQLIGRMEWAAPMDWTCEEAALKATGLTVREHQQRTVANYLELRSVWPDYSSGPCPFIPVLQGWAAREYENCQRMYAAAGVDLAAQPVVGLGSVCRRATTATMLRVQWIITQLGLPNLHAFGVKTTGLAMFGDLLASADSLAWSLAARHEPPLDGCAHEHCNNCMRFAKAWQDDLASHPLGPSKTSYPQTG